MQKILHTADWHLGAGRRLTKGSLDYLNRQVMIWREVIEVARREKCDGAMIVGDLAENAGTTIEEILALRKVLVEFGSVCPVLITAGNHDELSLGDFQTRWISLLDIPNVYVTQGQPDSVTLTSSGFRRTEDSDWDDTNLVKVLAMPWTGIKNQEEFDHKLKANYQGQQIVCLHECFAGIITDTGKALGGVIIPDIVGVRYFACGDIHKCFPGFVHVLTDYNESSSIENIYNNKQITHVLSYDLKNKKIEKRKILNRFKTLKKSNLTRIFLKENEFLTSTPDHPIYVLGKGFIPAESVKAGDKVITYDGEFEGFTYCNLCDFKTTKKELYSAHLSEHEFEVPEEEKHLSCSSCGKKFFSVAYLGGHKQNCGVKENFIKCDVCDWSGLEKNLGAHKYHHSEEQKHRNLKISKSLLSWYQTEEGEKHKTSVSNFMENAMKDPSFKQKYKESLLKYMGSKEAKNNFKKWSDYLKKFYKTDEGKMRLIKHGELMAEKWASGHYKGVFTVFPNKPEQKVIDLNIPNLHYVGDRSKWFKMILNGRVKGKNPDFISSDQKKVVEIMGFPYWHTVDEIEPLTKAYKEIGVDCLILDASMVVKDTNTVRAMLESFINNHYSEVLKVETKKKPRSRFVYNIEVEGNNNYFAVASDFYGGGKGSPSKGSPILVHNCQKVNLPHAWYSGAPGQWNFGDKPNKGCIVLEIHSQYEYTPRFVAIKSPIELHQIKSIEGVKDSPHWYQLIVPANEIPSFIPPNVKDLKPIPAKIEAPVHFSKDPENLETIKLEVDYCDGVEELLTEAGYPMDEILSVKQEIEVVARG